MFYKNKHQVTQAQDKNNRKATGLTIPHIAWRMLVPNNKLPKKEVSVHGWQQRLKTSHRGTLVLDVSYMWSGICSQKSLRSSGLTCCFIKNLKGFRFCWGLWQSLGKAKGYFQSEKIRFPAKTYREYLAVSYEKLTLGVNSYLQVLHIQSIISWMFGS